MSDSFTFLPPLKKYGTVLFALVFCLGLTALTAPGAALADDQDIDPKCLWEQRANVKISGRNQPDRIIATWIRMGGICEKYRHLNPRNLIYVKVIRPDGANILEYETYLPNYGPGEMQEEVRNKFDRFVKTEMRVIPKIGEDVELYYNSKIAKTEYDKLVKIGVIVFGFTGGYFDYYDYYYYDRSQDKLIKVLRLEYPG